MLAFQTAPKVITTKVTVRQLRVNGFDIHHPMLELLHFLKYPDCLVWGQTSSFTSGLKAIHEHIHGRRKCTFLCGLERLVRDDADVTSGEVLDVEECLGLLSEGHDTYYIYWLVNECISHLKKAKV